MYATLEQVHVAEAMHPGLVTCAPDASLRTVARMMATYRVHAILVAGHGGEDTPVDGGWGIVSDADLLRAAAAVDLDTQPADAIAAAPLLTVVPTDELVRAVQLMGEHDVSHLLVVDPVTERPVGVLSTLDVARALAGFPERHPGGE